MKRLWVHVVTVVLAICWSGVPSAGAPAPAVDQEQRQVEEALTSVLGGTDFQRISCLPLRWRRELPASVQRKLLEAFVARLHTTKELPLTNTGLMYVTSRVDRGKMDMPCSGQPLHRFWEVRQDVFLENGRCAWAIELMLRCRLPDFTDETAKNEKKLQKQAERVGVIVNALLPELRRESLDDQAAAAVKQLVAVEDFHTMFSLPVQWEYTLPETVQKKVIAGLLEHLDRTRTLQVVQDGYELYMESRVAAGKMQIVEHGWSFSQDVYLENGRCAWAIEWLLGRKIGPPFFTEELATDKKKLQEQIKIFTDRVIEAMNLPARTGQMELPQPVERQKPKTERRPGNG